LAQASVVNHARDPNDSEKLHPFEFRISHPIQL